MNIKSRKTRWICGILTVLFIAVGFAVFSSSDRKHIEYAEKLGCTVERENLFPWWVYVHLPQPFHSFIPEGSVVSISFLVESHATDADIEPLLGYFPELEHLDLSGTRITDATLKTISSHSNLLNISLDETMVTDKGVSLLSKSQSLTEVCLNGTKISDDSITHLSKMRQLRWLSVKDTPLTDKSVDILCNMPNLNSLYISGTQISEEGKSHLNYNIEQTIY